jgi:hypothetical protein
MGQLVSKVKRVIKGKKQVVPTTTQRPLPPLTERGTRVPEQRSRESLDILYRSPINDPVPAPPPRRRRLAYIANEQQLQQLQAQQLAAEEAAAPPSFLPRTPDASLGGAPEYKKGGLVKKTTFAKVHKGEVVIPKSRVNTIEKAVKKAGLKSILKPVKGKE